LEMFAFILSQGSRSGNPWAGGHNPVGVGPATSTRIGAL